MAGPSQVSRSTRPLVIGGFWARVGAFLLDVLLIAVMLAAWNLAAARLLVQWGVWAYSFDVALVWLYFGLFNSRLASGQTPGKRAAGIRVAGRDGRPIAVGRSLLRAAPIALSGGFSASFPPGGGLDAILLTSGSPLWVVLASFAARALGFGLIFFFVFNTKTRQALHDLLASTYVIRIDGVGPVPDMAVNRSLPVFFVSLLAVAAIVTTWQWPNIKDGVATYNKVAAAMQEIDGFLYLKTLHHTDHVLRVHVLWRPYRLNEASHRDVAKAVIANYPEIGQVNELDLTVGYGFGRMVRWQSSESRKMTLESWKREIGSL